MGRRVALFAALVLLPAGCSSGSNSGSDPADPVVLINKASGCQLTNGGPSGARGFNGFLVATCDYANGDSLTVKTFVSNSDRDNDIRAGGSADATITGPKWVAYYYGQGPADNVATELGGKLQ